MADAEDTRGGAHAAGSAEFTTTHWSVVLAAANQQSPQAAEALETLCRTYWYPLYAYVRRRGSSPEVAQDLIQEFFARFLARNYLAGVDRQRGRFRSYLLGAVNHFLADDWDRRHRLKRRADACPLPFDAASGEERYALGGLIRSNFPSLFLCFCGSRRSNFTTETPRVQRGVGLGAGGEAAPIRWPNRETNNPGGWIVINNQNMKPTFFALLGLAAVTTTATEFHVAPQGNDTQRGTRTAPFRTIQRAADLAQPGDVITVHQGVYRERINPPRGGQSDRQRIVYQAAPGETVEIKGSEVITNWVKVREEVWKATRPNAFFGPFNPYGDLIRGDWFGPKGRDHHTGAVYLNGDWLVEAPNLIDLFQPVGTHALWFGQVDQDNTTIWAQFQGVDPNTQRVEIHVRQTVFYPDKPGRNFITVRGFRLRHAATPWAPPTAEQVGLIGTHWSRGWIIEDNVVSHSTCSGIALGKHGDEFDNTSADTAEGYVKTIERAQAHPIAWTRENIGHHVVRRNTISHCEQAGIVGSLGAAFSTVTDNVIHDIHVRRLFTGAEMAGIKFHAAIDSVIRSNHIYRTCRGLWLDWMAQGTRVSGNLFHDNASEDLFVEVNHGPFMVDNNLFLSPTSLLDMSQGGAYAHNLFTGKIVTMEEPTRQTPYHPAHSTTVAGLRDIKGGDDRFYSNLFVGTGGSPGEVAKEDKRHRRVSGYGLWVYDLREYPLHTGGNVFYHRAQAYARETNAVLQAEVDPKVKLVEQGGQVILHLTLGPELKQAATTQVTTKLLGQARIPGLPYQDADGSPLNIGTDYFGKKRSGTHPSPGPFEDPGTGALSLQVR